MAFYLHSLLTHKYASNEKYEINCMITTKRFTSVQDKSSLLYDERCYSVTVKEIITELNVSSSLELKDESGDAVKATPSVVSACLNRLHGQSNPRICFNMKITGDKSAAKFHFFYDEIVRSIQDRFIGNYVALKWGDETARIFQLLRKKISRNVDDYPELTGYYDCDSLAETAMVRKK